MIGQNLALRYPDRLDSAALCDTMSVLPPGGERMWRERIDTATAGGMEPLAEPTMERWFTQPYRERHPERVDVIRQQFLRTPVAGYCGCCEAIMKLNYLELLANIAIPTKIIVGEDDMGTPVAASEAMHERIPRSTLTVIPAAAHLSNLEQP
ncbi:MAG: 3-oxoadipate enol-lactonase, partial [Gammaproteobacteria bacterium]|nr:3-oxoadipate enol-lactonase [Gammaproteobacteria bacterium]